jgi:hypothetical protein
MNASEEHHDTSEPSQNISKIRPELRIWSNSRAGKGISDIDWANSELRRLALLQKRAQEYFAEGMKSANHRRVKRALRLLTLANDRSHRLMTGVSR